MSSHKVISRFTAKEGKVDELLKLLDEASSLLEGEDCCFQYKATQDPKYKNIVIVEETWTCPEKRKASMKNLSLWSLILKAVPLVEDRPEETVIE